MLQPEQKTRGYESLILHVRFGGNLYYSKEKGYRTTQKAGLHQLFHTICYDSNPSLHADWEDFERLRNSISKIDFNTTRSILQASYAQNKEWFLDMYKLTKEQEILYGFDQI